MRQSPNGTALAVAEWHSAKAPEDWTHSRTLRADECAQANRGALGRSARGQMPLLV